MLKRFFTVALVYLYLFISVKAENSKVTLYCHGSTKYPSYVTSTLSQVELTCSNGAFQESNGDEFQVESASCSRRQEPEFRSTASSNCSDQGADGRTSDLSGLLLVQVGWDFEGSFVEQIRICVDEKMYVTLWTKYVIEGSSISFRDSGGSSPSFRRDITGYKRFFTGFSTQTELSNSYTKNSQRSQAEEIYGSNTLSNGELLIEADSGTNFFARGHLAPNAGFVLDVEQDATYYFFNVAPQFQSFNNANWKSLEFAMRDYASSKTRSVDIYSGTYDFLRYPDSSGSLKTFYLYTSDGNEYLPAPKYFWKVMHDRTAGQAMAFIGLNNPHEGQAPPPHMCTDKCSYLSWVDWDITDFSKGYMYCCDVADLKSQISYVPDLRQNDNWPDTLTDSVTGTIIEQEAQEN